MTLQKAIDSYNRRNGTGLSPIAALIDMDGTLYDSMPNHAQAWHRMISELGIVCTPEEFFLYEGRTGADTINIMWQRAYGKNADAETARDLYNRKAAYFAEMPQPSTIDGAQPAIATMMQLGLTTILVTGSSQPTTLNRLDTDFPGAFPADRRITSASVEHGKPHPEPFLKAMELIKAKPWQCIAIDNAPLGVESSAKSGAFTIGLVTGPIQPETLYHAGADIVYTSMNSLECDLPVFLSKQS